MTEDSAKRKLFSNGFSGHVQKKAVRHLAEGEDIFTVAEVEGLGFKGVKQFALDNGLLHEGRYKIAGRAKIKRMNYIDRAGLVLVIEHFRGLQGSKELAGLEASLEKLGKAKELKKLREARVSYEPITQIPGEGG